MTSGTVKVNVPVRYAAVEAVVTRCGCSTSVEQARHIAANVPCPSGVTEDLGTIAYYHSNPLRRLGWSLFRSGSR